MADYWKSNAKHFCEICKIWIADNRASVDAHEKGMRHKGAVQQRLRDMGKRAKEKEVQASNLNATLIAMEQAALAAMKRDGQEVPPAPSASGQVAAPRRPALPKVDPKLEVKERKRKLQELKRTAKASQFWNAEEEKEIIEWVQAEADGQHYYWNIFSGETIWDVPNRFYTTAEYNDNFEAISQRVDAEIKKRKVDDAEEQQRKAESEAQVRADPMLDPQNYHPRNQSQYVEQYHHPQQPAEEGNKSE
ncbi:WW domain-binding protein 4 [Aphelenchoides fujianensis]|nr:WW domain-binding protein 4 [Aphelenchoides fujianensis]